MLRKIVLAWSSHAVDVDAFGPLLPNASAAASHMGNTLVGSEHANALLSAASFSTVKLAGSLVLESSIEHARDQRGKKSECLRACDRWVWS